MTAKIKKWGADADGSPGFSGPGPNMSFKCKNPKLTKKGKKFVKALQKGAYSMGGEGLTMSKDPKEKPVETPAQIAHKLYETKLTQAGISKRPSAKEPKSDKKYFQSQKLAKDKTMEWKPDIMKEPKADLARQRYIAGLKAKGHQEEDLHSMELPALRDAYQEEYKDVRIHTRVGDSKGQGYHTKQYKQVFGGKKPLGKCRLTKRGEAFVSAGSTCGFFRKKKMKKEGPSSMNVGWMTGASGGKSESCDYNLQKAFEDRWILVIGDEIQKIANAHQLPYEFKTSSKGTQRDYIFKIGECEVVYSTMGADAKLNLRQPEKPVSEHLAIAKHLYTKLMQAHQPLAKREWKNGEQAFLHERLKLDAPGTKPEKRLVTITGFSGGGQGKIRVEHPIHGPLIVTEKDLIEKADEPKIEWKTNRGKEIRHYEPGEKWSDTFDADHKDFSFADHASALDIYSKMYERQPVPSKARDHYGDLVMAHFHAAVDKGRKENKQSKLELCDELMNSLQKAGPLRAKPEPLRAEEDIVTPEEARKKYPHGLFAIRHQKTVAEAEKQGKKVKVHVLNLPFGTYVHDMEIHNEPEVKKYILTEKGEELKKAVRARRLYGKQYSQAWMEGLGAQGLRRHVRLMQRKQRGKGYRRPIKSLQARRLQETQRRIMGAKEEKKMVGKTQEGIPVAFRLTEKGKALSKAFGLAPQRSKLKGTPGVTRRGNINISARAGAGIAKPSIAKVRMPAAVAPKMPKVAPPRISSPRFGKTKKIKKDVVVDLTPSGRTTGTGQENFEA